MPRRKNKSRGGGNLSTDRRSTIVPFRVVRSTALTTTTRTAILETPMIPSNMGQRIGVIAPAYGHWRLNRLRVYSFVDVAGSAASSVATSGANAQLGILPVYHWVSYWGVDHTKVGTTSMVLSSQFPCFKIANGYQQNRFTVPQKELRNLSVPWFETTTTGSESEALQTAGLVTCGVQINYDTSFYTSIGNASLTIFCIIEGECEFRDPIDSSIAVLFPSSRPAPEESDDESVFSEFVAWKKAHGKQLAAPPPH